MSMTKLNIVLFVFRVRCGDISADDTSRNFSSNILYDMVQINHQFRKYLVLAIKMKSNHQLPSIQIIILIPIQNVSKYAYTQI